MQWLVLASVIWGFSFGMIKGKTGHIDPFVLGAIRVLFAFMLSLVLFRRNQISHKDGVRLATIGLVQMGLMYAPYMFSFKYLQGHEVALFTMTTPIYVVAFNLLKNHRFDARLVAAALMAIAGGLVVAWKPVASEFSAVVIGFLLVQISNILFAAGQHLLMTWHGQSSFSLARGMPYYFLGALTGSVFCLSVSLLFKDVSTLNLNFTGTDLAVFAWLGMISTGLATYIWSCGTLKVTVGQLAVATDIKLPIAVAISLVVFGESADVTRVVISGCLLAYAAYFSKRESVPSAR